MPITRSYVCLNRNCQHEHTSADDYPPCPRCGGLRSKWLPKPFAISRVAAGIDQTVKEITNNDSIGRDLGTPMTNFRTPERGLPARMRMPINEMPGNPALPYRGLKLPDACFQGRGNSYCGTTGQTAPLRDSQYGFMGKPAAQSNLGNPTPVFEARHRGR